MGPAMIPNEETFRHKTSQEEIIAVLQWTDLFAGQRIVHLENGFLDKRFWDLPFRLSHLGSSSLGHDAGV